MAKYRYPQAGKNASAGARQSIQQFHRLPVVQKQQVPLLYFLLGSGTPPYKMSPADASYQNQPMGQQRCGNCIHAYQHVKSQTFICDQIRGGIQPQGWCRLWST